MNRLAEVHKHVLHKLTGLSPSLKYHNIGHTLDVLRQAEFIAKKEGVNAEEELLLLKVSALYHDVGFLFAYTGHEEKSCEVVENELSGFGFTPYQIEQVCGMIRATKVPQQPNNLLEEIICDADLDYLGRDDFFKTGEGLYSEFLDQKIVSDELSWNQLQVRFLENHHYFTPTSIRRRQKEKQKNLEAIKAKIR
ncbi:MAG TPA: HD domain-containing protein [Chitinophagaceae bacterium]